jgi:hypothetical protein
VIAVVRFKSNSSCSFSRCSFASALMVKCVQEPSWHTGRLQSCPSSANIPPEAISLSSPRRTCSSNSTLPGLAVAQPLVGHKSPSAGWTTGSLASGTSRQKCAAKVRFLTCTNNANGSTSRRGQRGEECKNTFCNFVFSAFFTFRLDSSSTLVPRPGIEEQQKAQLEKNKIGRERRHFFGFQPPKVRGGAPTPHARRVTVLGRPRQGISNSVIQHVRHVWRKRRKVSPSSSHHQNNPSR